jgi:hypothetical protein
MLLRRCEVAEDGDGVSYRRAGKRVLVVVEFCPGNETTRVVFKSNMPQLVRSWMQLSLNHWVASTADPVNRCFAVNADPPNWLPKMKTLAPPVLGVLG